jgi:hypothetical protein
MQIGFLMLLMTIKLGTTRPRVRVHWVLSLRVLLSQVRVHLGQTSPMIFTRQSPIHLFKQTMNCCTFLLIEVFILVGRKVTIEDIMNYI